MRTGRDLARLLALCGACLAAGACAAAPEAHGVPITNAELAFAGGPQARWLGLNGNSSACGAIGEGMGGGIPPCAIQAAAF